MLVAYWEQNVRVIFQFLVLADESSNIFWAHAFERHSEKAFLKILFIYLFFFFYCTGSAVGFTLVSEWRLPSLWYMGFSCSFSCLRARALHRQASAGAALTGSVVRHVGSSWDRDCIHWQMDFYYWASREAWESLFAVVVTVMFLFHNDTSIDLGNIVNLNNS